jgi:integrase
MPKRTSDGRYAVDLRPRGRNGPRFRKTFATQGEALAYERYIARTEGEAPPWQPQAPDRRRLSELAERWFELHGRSLKSGAKRMTELRKVIALLGDPVAKDFTTKDFTNLRAGRLTSVTANTANHDLTNLRSLFNELERLGEWQLPNPLRGVRKIKQDERELEYLTRDQIAELLAELDRRPESHARITARICLATGARWGEAATLRPAQVHAGMIHFTGTKSGKNRSIPVSPDLEKLILENAPLVNGMNTFKRAVAALDWNLPRGQMTHILRHTFASHYMMNGGNILALQRTLGHASLDMTMRYAHLAPDHMAEVLQLNPLSTMRPHYSAPERQNAPA